MPKFDAHYYGKLHRAFSVFIFNSKNELLLQQRADNKYHSSLLWTNTCCSHPRPGEPVELAAYRRLYEEMGIICRVEEQFSFVYNAKMDNGLTEYEYDHVFTGIYDLTPMPNAAEVAGYKYMSYESLAEDIAAHPERYTEWFKICVKDWKEELFDKNKKGNENVSIV